SPASAARSARSESCPTGRPSTKYARNSRSATSSCSPRALARCSTWCALSVLVWRTDEKSYSSPTEAAIAVARSSIIGVGDVGAEELEHQPLERVTLHTLIGLCEVEL